MRSQNVASQQLREYFLQPLEFSNFRAAERLLSSLDSEARAKATLTIIEAMVKGHASQEN
jgi:hypothetical protein